MSVFANPKQEVKSNVAQVGLGPDMGVVGLGSGKGVVQGVFHHVQWNGKLWEGWWIFAFVAANLLVQRCPVAFTGVWSMEGVWESGQFEGLANGAKRVLN